AGRGSVSSSVSSRRGRERETWIHSREIATPPWRVEMSIPSFIRKCFSRKPQPTIRNKRRHSPLNRVIEQLEERTVPAITFVRDFGASATTNANSLVLNVGGTGVAAGHTIILAVATDTPASQMTITASDSKGNTYTKDVEAFTTNKTDTLIFHANI